MSLNKDETAVRGCNPPVSVLVVWVSCKVYFSRSTISLAVLFVISVELLIIMRQSTKNYHVKNIYRHIPSTLKRSDKLEDSHTLSKVVDLTSHLNNSVKMLI